jgi:TonB-dependent Receptor Plug Domain
VLVLSIDTAGAVVDASAASDDVFATAAKAAAKGLRFRPAQRTDPAGVMTAVAARIKFKYRFAPPSPVLVVQLKNAESSAPLANTTVTIVGSDGMERMGATDAQGALRMTDLPPGKVTIRVAAADFEPMATDETLSFAEETALTLRPSPVKKPPTAEAALKPAEEAPEEVNVVGVRPPREVVKRTLKAEEIAQIPGTNGDALRAVQNLPGVARPPPFLGQLVVRGSNNEDTVIYVDGTPIPLVYHFGGLSSVIPTESTEKFDFYPGNFSAVYGRGMGGVVDITTRSPKQDKFHAMAQIDFIDARLAVEAPLGKGWSFRAAGRRSYFDAWLGPVLEAANAGVSTLPRYYDGQVAIEKAWSKDHTLRFSFFGADDAFKATTSAGGNDGSSGGSIGLATAFWRLQALYKNKLSENVELRVVGAWGRDIIDLGFGAGAIRTASYPGSLRAEVTNKVVQGVRANTGIDLLLSPYTLQARLPLDFGPGQSGVPGGRYLTSENDGTRLFGGAYTEWEIMPTSGTRIVPGIRADYTSTTEKLDLAPRINVRQVLIPGEKETALKGGVGLFYQPPDARESDPVFGEPGLKSKRSIQADVGVDQSFSEHLKLQTDVYYKTLDNLVVQNRGQVGQGRSFGFEGMLRFQGHPRFFGWASYTLSRSERRDGDKEPWQTFANDQTHILTVLGSYELGRGWRIGSRFRLISGNPYSEFRRGSYDSTVGAYLGATANLANTERAPLFHQLDVRVDKVWQFQHWKLALYIDIQNVYNHRSVEGVSPNYDYTTSSRTQGLTILPSFGLRGEL